MGRETQAAADHRAGGRPPSVAYELYPVAFIPPFHYANRSRGGNSASQDLN